MRRTKLLSFKEEHDDIFNYLKTLDNASLYVINLIKKDLSTTQQYTLMDVLERIDKLEQTFKNATISNKKATDEVAKNKMLRAFKGL